MAIGSWLAVGFLSIGAHWFPMSPIDLPYPEVAASGTVGGPARNQEALVAESAGAWAKRIAPGRKAEVSEIRIEGARATAKVGVAGRSWSLKLERVGEDWRILER